MDRGQESRGSLELKVTSSPTSGTQLLCRAAPHIPIPLTPHSLPSSTPCTSLLSCLALAAQALPTAEEVSLHFILFPVLLCHYLV